MMQHVALGDPIAGIYGAAALLAALWHRERTGEGQLVDLSHVEALFAMGVQGFLEQEIARPAGAATRPPPPRARAARRLSQRRRRPLDHDHRHRRRAVERRWAT